MHRLTGLDGLRAFAALMVFALHVQLPGLHPATLGLDAGVLVFFSLSGYLLYAPCVAARGRQEFIDIPAYAIKRVARILPAFLVASFGIAMLWHPHLLADPIGLLLGTQTPITVVWTLRIEVEFYLLLPLVALAMDRVARPRQMLALLVLAAGSIVTTVLVMAVGIQRGGLVPSTDLLNIASFLWAFVPGMVVAELQHQGALDRPVPRYVTAAGIGLVALSVILDPPPYLDVLAAAGSGLLVATIVSRRKISTRFGPVWVGAGALSYSFYLWHETVVDLVDRPTPTWGGALLALVLTTAIAGVVYAFIEMPGIRLGQRLATRSRKPRLPLGSRWSDQHVTGVSVSAPSRHPVELPTSADIG